MRTKQKSAFADRKMLGRAMKDSFVKLSPKTQAKNPVMFLVFVSAILTSILWVVSLFGLKDAPSGYTLAIAIILWFTVLFANFAEAIAEGRGKAQADSLRASRKDVDAHKIPSVSQKESVTVVPSALLKKGELVIVKAGEQIPADGEVIEGAASVDESAITGESAPVIREAGGDRSAVTGGTTVLSDWIVVRVTNEAGESFLDKMIAMVEGAARKKTPNEIALQIFLVALSIIFILVTVSLYTYSIFSAKLAGIENPTSVTTLVALLVCLAPTTIGALLSAIGIAGMSRLNQANVLAMSGRAIEAAGDVDILMLDKTGTITLGNRQASEFIPVDGVDIQELADAAQLSSLADETPEGRSVVVLAKEQFGIRGRSLQDKNMHFVPFTAVTRMSGVDFDGNEIRKGAADAMQSYVTHAGGMYSPDCDRVVKSIASKGGTPLVVAKNHKILGVIYLKDIIKQGVKEKFADLRKMGIKTIMITGDNPITAAAIAAEAGVDDFLAEATPEGKLAMIRDFQAKGHLVAMTGDGTNDAPALAQADVAVAMNSGTQAAKEAGNMVDLDSSPTKLIDIVRIGKQLLMTRGSLTTFSIANDVAKYFAIIPALFMGLYPGLSALNIMGLHSPQSAVLSAIIYNAHKATHPLAANMDIVGGLHVVKAFVLRQFGAEPVCRHGFLRVVLAPALIRLIQCFGAGLTVRLEADVALGLQELDHIVAAALDCFHILSGLGADCELIVVSNQPVQTIQTPEEDTLFLPQQLVHQKRIVRSACGSVFGGQHDLAAKETVGLVVQGRQRTVAKAEKSNIELALVALDALALHVHLALRGHDGFNIVGLGQGAHIHIIVHHQELVFQIRAAEPVALHLLDAGGVHAVAQQGAHDQTDAAFALAALADEHEHFLPLGGRQQAVTEKFLQGWNVLRLQQL